MNRLGALINALYASDVYSDERHPLGWELADALWLARYLTPTTKAGSGTAAKSPRPTLTDEKPSAGQPPNAHPGERRPRRVDGSPSTARQYEQGRTEARVHVREPSREQPDGLRPPGAATLRVARPRMLSDPLAIGRALRPLFQRVPSTRRLLLDEHATVHNLAELLLPIPVLRGVPERRFELALVVDANPAFILWEPLLAELVRLLSRHGAFRDLRVWRIGNDPASPDLGVRLWPGLSGGTARPPGILHDPRGRRAVLVFSDLSAPVWRHGFSPDADSCPYHLDALANWERRQPVALLQLLPQCQWRRTALGGALLTRLRAEPRAVSDGTIRFVPERPPELIAGQRPHPLDGEALTLPVLTLDAASLSAWSRLLGGRAGAWVPGARFLRSALPTVAQKSEPLQSPPLAREQLRRWMAGASEPARELARACAAMPLTLPVVRLVQQTCCVNTHPAHLAELFLGGLLQRAADQLGATPTPLEVIYDYPDGVRQLLIDSVPPDLLTDNLRKVSAVVQSQLGAPHDFLARYLAPDLPVDRDEGSEPSFRPFALIWLQLSQRLGLPDTRVLQSVIASSDGHTDAMRVAFSPDGQAEPEPVNATQTEHSVSGSNDEEPHTSLPNASTAYSGAKDPPHDLVSDLCAFLESYLPQEQVSEVYRAYLFVAEAHQGQSRKSGEPYIYHPLAVARTLSTLHMDYKCLIAAILLDVIEDTRITKDRLAEVFDSEVAELVDGVTKLSQIDFASRAEAQAASLQKMLLAMTRDIRVILIKLADRLHTMRTLGVMSAESRRRISRETLDIFAPIANRLGISSIRVELEELGFSHYWPWRHLILERAVQKASGARSELLAGVEAAIRRRLQQEGIQGEVKSRRKNLYSIYRTMKEKRRSFSDVVDVCGVQVTVDRADTCYRVLGQVHNLYKPVPGRYKDYIAIPKANGYQSLHTVLFGPQGVPLEIQIRTESMARGAESGIAAHWMYKIGGQHPNSPANLANDWLQNLLVMQQGAGNPQDFLDNVKVDLFPDDVYVFTPKGRILTLKRGATVVDFAYAIHSDLGAACVAGRIDRRLAALSTPLRSGQTVEIVTVPGAKPNPGWLGFVVTRKARAGIRGYLKTLKAKEAEALGRRLLNAELSALGSGLDQLAPAAIAVFLEDAGLPDIVALLADIGLGNRLSALVARRLVGGEGDSAGFTPGAAVESNPHRFAIRGTEGMVVTFARCCRPIPGDTIAAVFSPGRGIVVHRHECHNLSSLETRRHKRLDVEWASEPDGDFPVEIGVDIGNRRGALAVVAGVIAEQGAEIENVESKERDGTTSTLEFLVAVRDRQHLAGIMRRLRQIPSVIRITRIRH